MDLNITQVAAGHSAQGMPVSIFTLSNRHGLAIRISTVGAALLSVHAPDRDGRLANILHGGLAGDGIHLLPAPGRALHRQAWHAVPLIEDASVGVRLVSPGTLAVVASYILDDANTLTLRCEVPAQPSAVLSLATAFDLCGQGEPHVAADGHLLMVQAERVVPLGAHEQPVQGTPWDCRSARPLGDLEGPARYMIQGQGVVLRLIEPVCGRQFELTGDLASLRVGVRETPGYLPLELAMAAPGGHLVFHFSALS